MTNSMTRAEKLRFLADRIEDEKEFYIGLWVFQYQNDVLMEPCDINKAYSSFMKSHLLVDTILNYDLKQKPQWEFTEDEKAILRNLPDNYQWIARDENGALFTYASKPNKLTRYWFLEEGGDMDYINVFVFNHLFQSIQWSDEDPCEFRKYL